MKNSKILSILLTVIIASALIVAGVYAYRGWQEENSLKPGPAEPEIIGGEADDHGCLIAAGYSWCEAKAKCLRTWEEPCAVDSEAAAVEPADADVAGIKQAFLTKYKKTASEVQITINQFTGDFARGGVKFAMGGQFGEGGIFLAYKENGVWQLAFDGNGMYSCAEMEKYGFPANMIPDCAAGGPAEVACTMDAKLCPDGSAVGRVAPDCEFAPCPDEGGGTQLPNPASAYCEEQGGTSEIRTATDGSQSGVCKFTDGSECDEWKFFRGECGPKK
ncbi:MAG: DUF333 domain-containing protein [Planctomycetes bacterium]|jgi:putative hemolysin|nr:DUF333 domain-containing protein [Planctomycetota bacterium]